MAELVAENVDQGWSTQRFNRICGALVVLAAATPIVVAAAGLGETEWALKQLFRLVAMYTVIGGIAHFATRYDKEVRRAQVKLGVVIAVFVLGSIGGYATAKNNYQAKTFARLMLEHDRTYVPAINDINERFAKFDPSEGLSLESLVSAEGVETGRVNADRYVRLLDKRRDVVTAHAVEVQRIVDVSTSGEVHDRLASKIDADAAQSMRVFTELDAAQRAHAAAIDSVCKFAEQNRGKIQVHGGTLAFATPVLQAEFQTKTAAISTAEAAMEVAQQKADVVNEAALKARAEALSGVRQAAGE